MLAEIFAYKQWAGARTVEALRRVDAQRFPATLAFARQQLNHLRIVEELFRARLLGEPDPHPATHAAEVPELDALARMLAESDRWYAGYIGALPARRLDEPVRFRFADGQPGRMSRREMLFHVANHGTYHRGSIAHALDQAQVPHPADTYTVFIHATEPQRRLPG